MGQEIVYLGDRTVEDGYLESVVVHIEDKVLPHNSKPNQPNVTSCIWHIFSEISLIESMCASIYAIHFIPLVRSLRERKSRRAGATTAIAESMAFLFHPISALWAAIESPKRIVERASP
jgi:hypothetical protein